VRGGRTKLGRRLSRHPIYSSIKEGSMEKSQRDGGAGGGGVVRSMVIEMKE
jgi:hypothetical protein